MVRLYQDPEGKHIFGQEPPTGNVAPISTVFAPDTPASGQEKNERVRSRNRATWEKKRKDRIGN